MRSAFWKIAVGAPSGHAHRAISFAFGAGRRKFPQVRWLIANAYVASISRT
jgi:hypothetical protein